MRHTHNLCKTVLLADTRTKATRVQYIVFFPAAVLVGAAASRETQYNTNNKLCYSIYLLESTLKAKGERDRYEQEEFKQQTNINANTKGIPCRTQIKYFTILSGGVRT